MMVPITPFSLSLSLTHTHTRVRIELRLNRAFLEANQDKLIVMKIYAPWCKACKAMAPKFQMAAKDDKYKKLPIVFAELPIVGNKEYVKKLGVVALPSVQFYAGTDGLVDTFPCGPSKMGLFKRKVAQLVRERVDARTMGLKTLDTAESVDEEAQPCAERPILEETADQETELVVGGVKVSQEEMKFLRQDVPYFRDLADSDFSTLMKKARLLSFEPGNVIMKQGKRGRTFYVIQSGAVEVYVHTNFEDPLTTPPNYLGTMVNQLGKGDFFGERALITGEPRAASIRAEQKTRCFAFDINDVPSSSVLSGQGNASEDRIQEVNSKYGVDVQGLDVIEMSRQLEAAKLGSQIRGSVNSPERIRGVDYEDDTSDTDSTTDVATTQSSSSSSSSSSSPSFVARPAKLGLDNDAIIPLLLRFRLVRHATKCFEYINKMRPRWGDASILRRRTTLLAMLPASQKDEFKEVFDLIDTSGDGLIHVLELKSFMESIGEEKSDQELEAMVQKCGNMKTDRPADDFISFDDFMGIMAEAEFYTSLRTPSGPSIPIRLGSSRLPILCGSWTECKVSLATKGHPLSMSKRRT